jgi:putative (di)nucleoside polyphosphate hydrolase
MPNPFTGVLRENVAGLVVRRDGSILVGECTGRPGSWSFPQGGVNRGETRREALARELAEEVGLRSRDYRIILSRGGYAYEYPGGKLKKGLYRGQIQTYFLCQLLAGRPVARGGRNGKPGEFLRLRWVAPAHFDLTLVPGFKLDVTRRALADLLGVVLPLPDTEAELALTPDTDSDTML